MMLPDHKTGDVVWHANYPKVRPCQGMLASHYLKDVHERDVATGDTRCFAFVPFVKDHDGRPIPGALDWRDATPLFDDSIVADAELDCVRAYNAAIDADIAKARTQLDRRVKRLEAARIPEPGKAGAPA